MMSANLRDLGRLAAWPVGRLAGLLLLNLLLLGVLAMLWKCCTPPPVVSDFPIVERSRRGPFPVSLPLPFVVGLVAPSVQVRRPARQAKHRGQSRGLLLSRCWAYWPQSRWISPRYGSIRRQSLARPRLAHGQSESAEVARTYLRTANPRWAG